MSGSISAAQVRAGYIAAMGRELGELFSAASSELTWMHWRWRQHQTLFGEKQSRVDLLNEAAPFFFRMVHEVFFEDTLLAIARLVGPPESVGKPNLTIQRFLGLLHADVRLQNEVSLLVEKAKASAQFALHWRNRRLAHRDLDLVLRRNQPLLVPPLASVTPKQVDVSLSALRDVLNHIEMEYCNATTAYANSPTPGDAEALLYIIKHGLLRRGERRVRLSRGEPLDEDIRPPEVL
jgi:hypothetical protein